MDNGGWIVFQRRMDGSVDFYREWMDYIEGFGNLDGEFWLGLHKLNRLTTHTSQLRIELEDFDEIKKEAFYSEFRVDDAETLYTLHVSGYSGTAGDSLSYHNGMKFTTKDHDNDIYADNCAVKFRGAWWYKDCHQSNLNGHYRYGAHTTFADGVNWKAFREYHYSLKTTEMKTMK